MTRLFYGKIKQKLTPLDDPTSTAQPSLKEELFTHLPINVATDGADLYDGLSSFLNDVVDFEGKKSRMEISMLDVPPLLQIQLQVSFALVLLPTRSDLDLSACNLTGRPYNHTNPKHTSGLMRRYILIAFSKAAIQQNVLSRKIFNSSSRMSRSNCVS